MKPYNSCGNGSAMRVGPVGWACSSKEEVLRKTKESAECTHNHPEGIKGAQSTSLCIFMARSGDKKEMIRDTISREFGYNLDMSVDEIRGRYSWSGLDGGVMAALVKAVCHRLSYVHSKRPVLKMLFVMLYPSEGILIR